MTELAAAAARLAHGDQPLIVPIEPAPENVPVTEDGMVRLFIAAGRDSGVRPADIVGAIANEAGVPGKAIGAIDIYDDFTFVEVPAEFYPQVMSTMTSTTIRNMPAKIRPATERDTRPTRSSQPYGADKTHGPRAGGKKYIPKNQRGPAATGKQKYFKNTGKRKP
jgi:hypothetical protein